MSKLGIFVTVAALIATCTFLYFAGKPSNQALAREYASKDWSLVGVTNGWIGGPTYADGVVVHAYQKGPDGREIGTETGMPFEFVYEHASPELIADLKKRPPGSDLTLDYVHQERTDLPISLYLQIQPYQEEK